MSTRVNSAAIGGFVVGAIVLLLVALLVWGGTGLLRSKLTYVLFFDSAVTGLNKGAPVLARGVKIGEVAAMSTGCSDLAVKLTDAEDGPLQTEPLVLQLVTRSECGPSASEEALKASEYGAVPSKPRFTPSTKKASPPPGAVAVKVVAALRTLPGFWRETFGVGGA